MIPADTLAKSRITILGLGLMGGSLGLALNGCCRQINGSDLDPAAIDIARRKGIFTKLSTHPADVLSDADLVILATPIKTIIELIRRLPELHPGSPVVMDIGSTKTEILVALNGLPSRFDPLGGHPMSGKEVAGFENADADLFRGASFAFTALERTSQRAKETAEQISLAVGAQPVWIDAESHDKWVAATSHLPYILASVLAMSTPIQAKPLVGPGFRSTTRVAGTPASLMVEILASNQENVLNHLDNFIELLGQYRELFTVGEYSSLKEMLEASAVNQRRLTANSGQREQA